MAFTTMAQVLAAMPGQVLPYSKQSVAAVTGAWVSYWAGTGIPGAGATPSSGLAGDVPTNATAGAVPFVNPASGGLYLSRFSGSVSFATAFVITLYDRLWHNSGISATAVTAQTINSVALTRPDALGGDVEAWWQVYGGAMGAGTPQITLTYTDQDGNTGNTGLSGVLGTAMTQYRTGPFSLASGDTGVRSIQTYQADASFTSGTLGLVMRRRLATVTLYDAKAEANDVIRSALEQIPNNACLELIGFTSTGATMVPIGMIEIING